MSQAAFGRRIKVSWCVGGSEAAGFQREQQMDGDVAGTGAPCLPAAIRHALMIMSHLLPGRRAATAAAAAAVVALGSKKKIKKKNLVATLKSPFHDRLSRRAVPAILSTNSSLCSFPCAFPVLTFKVPADSFLLSLSIHPFSLSPNCAD